MVVLSFAVWAWPLPVVESGTQNPAQVEFFENNFIQYVHYANSDKDLDLHARWHRACAKMAFRRNAHKGVEGRKILIGSGELVEPLVCN